MAAPTVTVITIFLDAERFLAEAVQSVLAQTYTDWELLLVDDGSRDESTRIARSYASRAQTRIRYLKHLGHRNRGMSATRNLGVKHARGRYVAFLDSDDVLLPQTLAEEVALLGAHPEAAMVCGRALYWYGWTGRDEDARADRYDRPASGQDRDVVPAPRLLPRFLEEGIAPCMCSLLVRKSALREVGGFERRFRGLYEDQAFYAKIALRYGVLVRDECWSKYRQHSAATCAVAAASGGVPAGRRRYLLWLERHVARSGAADPLVTECLGRVLAPFRTEDVRLQSGPGGQSPPRTFRGRYGMQALREFVTAAVAAAKALLRGPRTARAPRVGRVDFGDLRCLAPVSRHWGFDRGRPVDRYYIEAFLKRHADDIHGRVLEVGDDAYTRRFGGKRVTRRDVLHVSGTAPTATIIADLTDAPHVESDAFDCIILTQTLQLVYDVHAAIRTLQRILRPSGVLLLTVPGITPTTDDEWRASWYWSFTTRSLSRLAAEAFPPGSFRVESHGNVLAATAFLQGMAWQELAADELLHHDQDFPVTVTLRATKPPASPAR